MRYSVHQVHHRLHMFPPQKTWKATVYEKAMHHSGEHSPATLVGADQLGRVRSSEFLLAARLKVVFLKCLSGVFTFLVRSEALQAQPSRNHKRAHKQRKRVDGVADGVQTPVCRRGEQCSRRRAEKDVPRRVP